MNVRAVTTKITTRLLVLTIAISIFAAGFVSTSNLAYAYLKILSPTKGQKIPAGSIVNITGTSTPANATSQCVVSVIINGIHPYQKGQKGLYLQVMVVLMELKTIGYGSLQTIQVMLQLNQG